MVQCICAWLDVEVTGEGGAIMDAVERISYSMVWCSAFVLGVDIKVTREYDAVISMVEK